MPSRSQRIRRPVPLLVAPAIVAVAAVIGFGLLIVADPSWSDAELKVVIAVNAAHNAALDVVARVVNTLFGPGGAPLVGLLLVALVLLLAKSWAAAVRAGILLTLSWGLAEVVKAIVQRPRPDATQLTHLIVADPLTNSYPSGHTAFAVAVVCTVVLVLARRPARYTAIACGAVLVLVTAWSRVYLGVHYPTDVLASIVVVPAFAVLVHAILSRIRVFAVAPLIGGGA